MSTMGAARVATESGDSYEQRATLPELFSDLVFDFALTQVTGFLADHPTWLAGGRRPPRSRPRSRPHR